MVGKIKHVRQKRHQEAVKIHPGVWRDSKGSADPQGPPSAPQGPPPAGCWGPPAGGGPPQNVQHDAMIKENKQTVSSFPSGIFSGTKISREALVQTLKIEQTADVVVSPCGPKDTPGVGEKKLKSKKEKMKERRERWLNKISSIQRVKQEQEAAEARRKSMPVVGDMKALAEALPELSTLLSVAPTGSSTSQRRSHRKNRLPVKKKAEPTDFSLMKQPMKRKFLESESSRFGEAARSLAAAADPLADIAETLRKRMREEEEGGAS